MKIIGYRKLIALWSVIIAALIGAIYVQETMYIALCSVLTAGLGIFSLANANVHKHTDNETDEDIIEPDDGGRLAG